MRKLSIALLMFTVLLVGCRKEPLAEESTNNAEFTVAFLFENNGIKVYRFYDGGRPIYYTDARGMTAWSVTNTQRNGKSTSTTTTDYQVNTER